VHRPTTSLRHHGRTASMPAESALTGALRKLH
jgi:hypothetical protein